MKLKIYNIGIHVDSESGELLFIREKFTNRYFYIPKRMKNIINKLNVFER